MWGLLPAPGYVGLDGGGRGGDGGAGGSGPGLGLGLGGDGGAWRISRARLDAKWSADIRKRRPRFLPFVRARQWARAQWMTSEDEWTEWVMSGEKRMALVPSEPDSVYAESGWSSWDDFLNGPVDPDMPPPKARNPAAPQPPRTPTKISMCASDGEGEADAAVDDDDASHDGTLTHDGGLTPLSSLLSSSSGGFVSAARKNGSSVSCTAS